MTAFPVMCPAGWPAGARPQRDGLRVFGASNVAYLLEDNTGFGERSPVFHVLIGGQRRPFRAGFEGDGKALRITTRRVEIPMAGGGTFTQQLPARVVRMTTVHGERAGLLRAPRYPQGGIHGDHMLVMWNEDGHGYVVSAHSETSRRKAADVALRLARSTRAAVLAGGRVVGD